MSVIILSLVQGGRLPAEDWPQFRGPNCQGVSPSKKPLPAEFSGTKNVRWSAVLGDGIGSPAVADGRVFSTAMVDTEGRGQKLVVHAFDVATGMKLWEKDLPAGPKPLPPIHHANSYASASPAADAERVYVYFVRSGLVALDARTGEEVWRLAVPEPFFIFDWGPGMSPVLHGDVLFFCQDDDLYCRRPALLPHADEIDLRG
jgi:outer membrane protein assembly factor BamB